MNKLFFRRGIVFGFLFALFFKILLVDGTNLFSLPFGIRNNLLPGLENYPWVKYYKKSLRYIRTYDYESEILFVPCADNKQDALEILNTELNDKTIKNINETVFMLLVRENEVNYHYYSRSFWNQYGLYNLDQLRSGLAVLKCSYFEFYEGTDKSETLPIGRWKGKITHKTPEHVADLISGTIDTRYDPWGLTSYTLLSSELVEDDTSVSKIDIWKVSVFSDTGGGNSVDQKEYRYKVKKNDGEVFYTIKTLRDKK